MTGIDRSNVDAWQRWLAIEHEAVWLYGVIGGRVSDLAENARLAWDRHRDTRDRLTSLIRAAGAEPDGPQLGYGTNPINTAAAGRVAAQGIEETLATAALACMSDGSVRSEVITALRSAARSAAEWGAKPSAFPGLSVQHAR
jgi:hypothetical protein